MQQQKIRERDWYDLKEVQYEMISFLKDREMACIVPSWCNADMQISSMRNIRCHSTQQLDYLLNRWYQWKEKNIILNLYYSMARYKGGVPIFKDKHQRQIWKSNYFNSMEGYDWLIDVDADSHDDMVEVHRDAGKIKAYLDSFKIPYRLRFSGKGFHIIVNGDIFKGMDLTYIPFTSNNYFGFFTRLSKILNIKISKYVDWRIPDSRRVAKIPYSLAWYEDKAYMCLPFLTDREFTEFKLEDALPERWIGRIRGRGEHVFNGYDMPDIKGFLEAMDD